MANAFSIVEHSSVAQPEQQSDAELITFGCRLNIYESEVMKQHAAAAGLGDVIIVNTCAVTAEAERKARQAIRKARRDYPERRIVVTGCAAQVSPESFAKLGADHVIGNDLKLKAETWQDLAKKPQGLETSEIIINDIMEVQETAGHLVQGFDGRARAFLQVQNGCDHRCTFCIIPYGRGNSRSVPIGEIAQQTRMLVQNGVKEIVFTGVDVTSYGPDLPGGPSLGQMIRRVLALVPELPRLRLSSLDPVEIDDDLWHLIENEPRLRPHLHLSLQAGDDMILTRMKRRHLRADAVAFCARARGARPDIVFGADIIAGFPTETDAMFQNSLNIVEECGLTYLHIFPFSPRAGTPAAKMPQVHGPKIKERAQILREKGQAQEAAFYAAQHGKTRQLLIEHNNTARSEHFAPVTLRKDHGCEVGSLVGAKLSWDGKKLLT